MPHVDDGTLHALLDGALRAEDPARVERVEAHLATCADCRARLEQAAALKEGAAGVLDALDATPAGGEPAAPDFAEVMARAGALAAGGDPTGVPDVRPVETGDEGPDPHRAATLRRYRWTRGLAWAATIVIALGTGYLIRDLGVPGVAGPTMTDRQAPGTERASPEAAADRAREPASAAPAEGGPVPSEAASPGEQSPRQLAAPLEPSQPPARAAAAEAGAEPPAGAGGEPAMPPGLTEGELDAIALEEVVVTGVADGTVERRWVATDPEGAEARVGPILVLPGARIAGTERSADGGAVRTLQLLPGDVEVQVVQSASMPAGDTVIVVAEENVSADREVRTAAGPERAMAGADAARAPALAPAAVTVSIAREQPELVSSLLEAEPELMGARLDSIAAAVPEPRTVTVTRGGTTLVLTGRLPPELLRALATQAAAADGG